MENQYSDNEYKINICKRIDNWLKVNKQYSSASFARELGISDTSVKRWRKCVCAPDASLMPKICEIMNVSLSYLFGISSNTNLSKDEENLINLYRTDIDFKHFIDNYLSKLNS